MKDITDAKYIARPGPNTCGVTLRGPLNGSLVAVGHVPIISQVGEEVRTITVISTRLVVNGIIATRTSGVARPPAVGGQALKKIPIYVWKVLPSQITGKNAVSANIKHSRYFH